MNNNLYILVDGENGITLAVEELSEKGKGKLLSYIKQVKDDGYDVNFKLFEKEISWLNFASLRGKSLQEYKGKLYTENSINFYRDSKLLILDCLDRNIRNLEEFKSISKNKNEVGIVIEEMKENYQKEKDKDVIVEYIEIRTKTKSKIAKEVELENSSK